MLRVTALQGKSKYFFKFTIILHIGLVNQYYGTHRTYNDKLINYSAAKYLLCKNCSKILCKLVCLKFVDQFVSLVISLFEKCTVFKREEVIGDFTPKFSIRLLNSKGGIKNFSSVLPVKRI